MSDDREFKDKAGERDLGDPATDRPLTLRVHPDDDPMDPQARRAIKTTGYGEDSWLGVTARVGIMLWSYEDERVADWPYTSGTVAGAAFLPADEHHGLTVDYDPPSNLGVPATATCSCGAIVAVTRKYDAAEWHREHRRQARNATAQAAERGDMDERAFKASGR